MSSEPLTYAGTLFRILDSVTDEDVRPADISLFITDLRSEIEAEYAASEAPRPRSEGTKTWHDGMTLVTHPDGTRCWHREPQWVEAGSPRSDAVLDRAIPHRTDDQPCACDECLGYLCEDNGVAFDRLPALDRERLRRQVPDDRLDAACEWVAPNPLNEYAVTYCETHDRPADQCAALPSPRSDDREGTLREAAAELRDAIGRIPREVTLPTDVFEAARRLSAALAHSAPDTVGAEPAAETKPVDIEGTAALLGIEAQDVRNLMDAGVLTPLPGFAAPDTVDEPTP